MNKGVKIYLLLVVLLLILTASIYAFFSWNTMVQCPKLFFLMPLFYLLDGISLAIILSDEEKQKKTSVKKLALIRLIRISGSLIILFVGILADRVNMLAFVAVFVIYYIFYLVFETMIMQRLNKKE